MGKRTGINEITIKRDKVEADGAIYLYNLVARESGRVVSYRIPLYSIGITMIDKDGKETKAEARDAFADIGKALVFYEKVVEHLATPLNLPYVLEDEYCT